MTSKSGVTALLILVLLSTVIANEKPNIILFVADDVGYGDLSCYGHPSQVPSGIDKLAETGKRFTAAYVPDPTGVASRGALLTGRLPVRIGLYGSDGDDDLSFTPTHSTGLPQEEETLAEILKANGYRTGMVGKWNLGINSNSATDGAHLPKNHGFDFVGYNLPFTNSFKCGSNGGNGPDPMECFLYKDDAIVDQPFDPATLTSYFLEDADDFIEASGEDPFFLYFAFSNNHVSIASSPSFKDTSPLGGYGDSTNEMGHAVAEIQTLLEDLGKIDDTLIIFISDNGPFLEMCSDAGYEGFLKGGKSTMYEGGIRVPLIVSWPAKIQPASVARQSVSSMDLFPTIVDIISASLPTGITYDGTSIKSLLYEWTYISKRWGFETSSIVPDPHPEGLFYYSGQTLVAMRFDKFKVHFQLQPQPLLTRAEHGKKCLYGVPQREFYSGCRNASCFEAQAIPIVYLIDEDLKEGYRFTNLSDVNAIDPNFEDKMKELSETHKGRVTPGTALLSATSRNENLQPCCDPPTCRCSATTVTTEDPGASSRFLYSIPITLGLSLAVLTKYF